LASFYELVFKAFFGKHVYRWCILFHDLIDHQIPKDSLLELAIEKHQCMPYHLGLFLLFCRHYALPEQEEGIGESDFT
jgi:hypothetical protein